jgi:hypothetical protein
MTEDLKDISLSSNEKANLDFLVDQLCIIGYNRVIIEKKNSSDSKLLLTIGNNDKTNFVIENDSIKGILESIREIIVNKDSWNNFEIKRLFI